MITTPMSHSEALVACGHSDIASEIQKKNGMKLQALISGIIIFCCVCRDGDEGLGGGAHGEDVVEGGHPESVAGVECLPTASSSLGSNT